MDCLIGCKVALRAFVGFSPVCVFLNASSFGWEQAKSHWVHIFDLCPLCIIKCILKWLAWIDAYSHWLHLFCLSPVCSFKCVLKLPIWEDAYLHRLPSLVSRFPTVCFWMSAQISWLRRCIITLGALFDLSLLCFQMSSQMKCMTRCRITNVAFF